MRMLFLVLALTACSRDKGAANNVQSGQVAYADAPMVARPTSPPADAPQSKEQLYKSCKDRVENPQAKKECTVDADCAKTGCGREVCTTKAVAAEGLMTTCEKRLCFSVLDSCGCHEGSCSWTLKDPVLPKPLPEGAEQRPLPQ